MKKESRLNRVIVIMAEGETERAARPHLKRFLDDRAGHLNKVRIQSSLFDGGLHEAEARGRARRFLADPDVIGVIALVDLYPQLDLAVVAAVCPELKAFLNTLLKLAAYPVLS